MEADKLLIVNADDFGQSPGISEGIVEAVDRGIVTSASLMVRWPDAGEAVRRWRQKPAVEFYGERFVLAWLLIRFFGSLLNHEVQ